MKKEYDIATFSKLADGGSFFLREAFHYINESLTEELTSIIFARELKLIEPTDKDRVLAETIKLPESSVDLLRFKEPEILTEETIGKMNQAWNKAQYLAKTEHYKFSLTHNIESIELLGHLNNFGFFVETLINRHLLFLNQQNLIDDFSYARISIAKVMERIIYIFKEDLQNKKIHLNEIVNLFSLRNKTVHYTPDNAIALKPKIAEVISIWTQTVKLIQKLEAKEKFNEQHFSILLKNNIDSFKVKWTK